MSDQENLSEDELKSFKIRKELMTFGIAQYEDGIRDGQKSIIDSLTVSMPVISLNPELLPGVEFAIELIRGALADQEKKRNAKK